jgi:hypothetical protein
VPATVEPSALTAFALPFTTPSPRNTGAAAVVVGGAAATKAATAASILATTIRGRLFIAILSNWQLASVRARVRGAPPK